MKSYHFYTKEKCGSFNHLMLNDEENILAISGNESKIDYENANIEIKKSAPTKERGYDFKGIKFDSFLTNQLFYGANHQQGPVLGCVDIKILKNINEYKCNIDIMTSFDKPKSQPHITGMSTNDGLVKLWDSRENKETQLCSINQCINHFQYNPINDNFFAICTPNKQFMIYDMRKLNEYIMGWYGHTWHPNDENILATASMDHLVNIWNIENVKKPLYTIKNSEVGKIRWLNAGENGTHSIGIGARSMDKTMTIWDLNEPYCPLYAFKNSNKSFITDFTFSKDKQHAYLISKDFYVIVQSIDQATKVIDERRGNSLACDLTDGYVFGWDTNQSNNSDNISKLSDMDKKKKTKPSKRLNFINVTNFKSCYEESHNPFETMDEEYLLFITEYKTEGEDIIENLQHNKQLAEKHGKVEISAIWASLLDLVNDEHENEPVKEQSLPSKTGSSTNLRRKASLNTKIEIAQSILKFYKENQEQFEFDLQNKKITIKEHEIFIHEDYETDLLAKVEKFNEIKKQRHSNQNLTLKHKSQIISKVLQDMIDNGEFIHAYKMYLTLSKFVNVTEEMQKLWEFTYIDILGTMGFYTRATETIKNSKVENIKEMNKNDTILRINCVKCGKSVAKNNEGYCDKCKSFSVYCSVCSRPCKGLMLWCQICSHGGHMKEIVGWFKTEENGEGRTCPTGCGCKCFKF